jgi:hypothetical protein
MPRADTHKRVTATGTDTSLKEIYSISISCTVAGIVQLREGAAGTVFWETDVPVPAAGTGPGCHAEFFAPLVAQSGQTWQVVFPGAFAGVVCVNGQPG